MRNKKGQAAIEFLTTYSWAIMIIFLSIGALTYFDIFNTTRFISERCETGAQISCVEAMLTEEGDFSIRLTNNFPVEIMVESITIKPSGTSGVTQNFGVSNSGDIGISAINTFDIIGLGTFSSNTREQLDITIKFSRNEAGAKDYELKGNVVVRPLSP